MEKVTDFNRCWCEATEEHCKQLGLFSYGAKVQATHYIKDLNFKKNWFWSNNANKDDTKGLKQIYFINGDWYYVEDKIIAKDEPKEKDYISIKDNDGTEYKFEKPDFDCELLKVINDYIIGYVVVNTIPEPVRWSFRGKAFKTLDYLNSSKSFNLTPYKELKRGYKEKDIKGKFILADEFEYEIMAIFKDYNDGWITAIDLDGNKIKQKVYKCRPATKKKISKHTYNGDNK